MAFTETVCDERNWLEIAQDLDIWKCLQKDFVKFIRPQKAEVEENPKALWLKKRAFSCKHEGDAMTVAFTAYDAAQDNLDDAML